MTDSAGGLSGRQWSGVAGGAFSLAAVGLIALASGGRSNPCATAALALSAGGGAVAGLLWWRFVERPGAYTCSRGASVGVATSLLLHLLLTVGLLPFGVLAVVLVPVSWAFALLTAPVGGALGAGLICVRRRAAHTLR